jgi:hypothetical protein
VYQLLTDHSRLLLLRKIGTCGKSACPFVHHKKGGGRDLDLKEKEENRREVKQVFTAAYATEGSAEPWEGVFHSGTN